MNVGEFIEKLKQFDQNLPVAIHSIKYTCDDTVDDWDVLEESSPIEIKEIVVFDPKEVDFVVVPVVCIRQY